MARQLDILALEPFYGGIRKQTLDLLPQHSRHRWTVLKLPARRLERRLSTAAQWFTQQLARLSSRKFDVLFASDAMNLADFLRLNPSLGHKPSVAYFYCNQLASEVGEDQQARLAMLSTATCATEMWFNSLYHLKGFLSAAGAVYDGHPELGGKEPLRALVAKSQVMHPPVEMSMPGKDSDVVDAERKGRTVCLDSREGTSAEVFRQFLTGVAERKEPVAVHVLGNPIPDLPDGVAFVHVTGKDDAEVVRTLRRCEIFISTQRCDQFDPLAMRAMAFGCIPVLPREGFYSEFLPKALHAWCLYDGTGQDLLNRIMDLWYLRRPAVARRDLDMIFDRYAPIASTKLFDDRLEYMVAQNAH